MRILFDQGTLVPLRALLVDHDVSTAFELGWSTLSNGELSLWRRAGSLRYQQNLSGRQLAVLALTTTSWRRMEAHGDEIIRAVAAMTPGEYRELAS